MNNEFNNSFFQQKDTVRKQFGMYRYTKNNVSIRNLPSAARVEFFTRRIPTNGDDFYVDVRFTTVKIVRHEKGTKVNITYKAPEDMPDSKLNEIPFNRVILPQVTDALDDDEDIYSMKGRVANINGKATIYYPDVFSSTRVLGRDELGWFIYCKGQPYVNVLLKELANVDLAFWLEFNAKHECRNGFEFSSDSKLLEKAHDLVINVPNGIQDATAVLNSVQGTYLLRDEYAIEDIRDILVKGYRRADNIKGY